MTDTAWVALITAGSTLSASAIAGIFAHLAVKRQTLSQEAIQRMQLADARDDQSRSLRREAYAGVLNCHSKVEQEVRSLWESVPCREIDESAQHDVVKAAIHELQERIFLAELEGPMSLVSTTSRMMHLETRLMSDFWSIAAQNHASEFPVWHFEPDILMDAEVARLDVRTEFTREARVILGGVL